MDSTSLDIGGVYDESVKDDQTIPGDSILVQDPVFRTQET